MTFGRKNIVTNELDISGAAHLLQDGREFLRMWAQPGGPATCLVDPAALGHPITLFVEVELISETAVDIDATKSVFLAAPEVQQCYYVTGEVDFMLVVLVPSMAAYEALTRRLFFANPNIRKFRSFVAMDRVKTGLAVPIS